MRKPSPPIALLSLGVGAVLLIAACSDSESNPLQPLRPPTSNSAARAQIDAAVHGRKARGFEDEILRLENAIPGLGGMFRDSSGALVAYVTDLGHSQAALRAFASNAPNMRLDAGMRRDLLAGHVQFRVGQYPFSQLVAWQSATLGALAKEKGLLAVDADESTNRVHLRVKEGTPLDAIQARLTAAGIPASAVSITYDTPLVATTQSIRTRFPNGIAGGVQIGFNVNHICSLGFNVISDPGNEWGFLTAAHCTSGNPWDGTTGDIMYQNVVSAGYDVGVVKYNTPFTRTDAACAGRVHCTWADVLFVQYSKPQLWFPWLAATTSLGTNNNYGSIQEYDWRKNMWKDYNIYVGKVVDKVGRTTGWTRGTVTATCEADVVDQGLPDEYMVLCSDRVINSSTGLGDSGAPFMVPGADTTWALGILFAGGPINTNNGVDAWCQNTTCTTLFSDFNAIENVQLSGYFQVH